MKGDGVRAWVDGEEVPIERIEVEDPDDQVVDDQVEEPKEPPRPPAPTFKGALLAIGTSVAIGFLEEMLERVGKSKKKRRRKGRPHHLR